MTQLTDQKKRTGEKRNNKTKGNEEMALRQFKTLHWEGPSMGKLWMYFFSKMQYDKQRPLQTEQFALQTV